jgi:hypothetical protein
MYVVLPSTVPLYRRNRVLKVSSGFEDVGGLQWELVGTLFLSWVLVYLCICKGVK